MSQSLWNRAVSYDLLANWVKVKALVSIPLEQGSVLRLRLISIPFGIARLNPFGTGQCLTTSEKQRKGQFPKVSIPLEQGSVLRQGVMHLPYDIIEMSQSLWNRAVSYDT